MIRFLLLSAFIFISQGLPAQPDAPDSWSYILTDAKPLYKDSVKPIAQLTFKKTQPVNDSVSQSMYKTGFLPRISFYVFEIGDSAYCFRKSVFIHTISSCRAPNVGGDIIVFGRFIFLNEEVCLQCTTPEDGVDYCRPIIKLAFLKVDKTKAGSLEQIVKQFPFKGEVIK